MVIWYVVGSMLFFTSDIEYDIVDLVGIFYLIHFYVNVGMLGCVVSGICYGPRNTVSYRVIEEDSMEMNRISTQDNAVMYEEGKNEECLICAEGLKNREMVIRLDCSSMHVFHENCLRDWIKINPICPVCRSYIS